VDSARPCDRLWVIRRPEELVYGVPTVVAVAAPVHISDQLGSGPLGISFCALHISADVAVAAGLGVTNEGDPHLPAVVTAAADGASYRNDDASSGGPIMANCPALVASSGSQKVPLTSGGSGI
jgi:hypothetical protein